MKNIKKLLLLVMLLPGLCFASKTFHVYVANHTAKTVYFYYLESGDDSGCDNFNPVAVAPGAAQLVCEPHVDAGIPACVHGATAAYCSYFEFGLGVANNNTDPDYTVESMPSYYSHHDWAYTKAIAKKSPEAYSLSTSHSGSGLTITLSQ